MQNTLLTGYVVKRGKEYLCYNSYAKGYHDKPSWYWGPSRLSEIFTSRKRALEMYREMGADAVVEYGHRGSYLSDKPDRTLRVNVVGMLLTLDHYFPPKAQA